MYPLETRELAVEAVAAGFSLTEAAELAGCSRTAVVNWAKAAGVAPPPRKKAVYLPFDRKMELVARLEAGERAADLAAEAGVTAAAVSGWRRRLREEGALSLMTDSDIAARAPEPREAPSELEELRARCEELELRNAVLEGTIDILKKDPGADLSALTAAERAALADRLRGRFGLRAALAALSLPRSTFYDRLAAASAPDPYAALRPLVRAAFEASGGAYGYRRVRAELARGAGAPQRARGAAGLDPARPVAVSEKVVRRIMAEEGLRARAPRAARYSSYAGEEGRAAAPNLLLVDAGRDLHDFSAAAPGEVLVTDITEFRLPDDPRKVYLSPAVDLFDGDVAAFSVGTSPSKALVAEMLAGAVAAAGGGFTLHSDRGWHYRTPDWVRACGEAGVERSMSRKGHSPDNAACEGFFGRLKVEFFHGRDWRGVSAERFAAELAEWIRWYREGRLKAFDEGGRKVYDTIAGRRSVSATAKSAERATLSRRRRPRFPAGGATALWPPALPRAAAQGALDRGVVEVRGPDLNLQRRGALGVPGRDRPARDLPSAELREPDRHGDVLCAERGQPPRGVGGPHDCPLSGSPSPSAASASRSFMR